MSTWLGPSWAGMYFGFSPAETHYPANGLAARLQYVLNYLGGKVGGEQLTEKRRRY